MEPILLFLVHRIVISTGGIICIYLGYRLFYVVQEKQGEFKVKYGKDMELSLSQVAPGIFFAIFGTAILTASLFYKINIDTDTIPLATSVQNESSPSTTKNSPPISSDRQFQQRQHVDGLR